MSLYESKTYMADLDRVIKETVLLKNLRNASVFITGGTGLIGSAIVDILLRFNEMKSAGVDVFVAGRSEQKLNDRFSRYKDDGKFHFIQYDSSKHNKFDFHVDYIIHAASNAAPVDFQAHSIETMLDNFCGLYELLDYAEKEHSLSTVYVSSSEIYGKCDKVIPLEESEYGVVDILNTRSAYASSKRAAETLCVCYSAERNVRTSIVRPGHIYGPTARREDNRVSSAFAFDAADGIDLVLKSDGGQIRSYCYMLDAATAIITVLLEGKTANAYNISNPKSVISIKKMAENLAEYAGVSVRFDRPCLNEKKSFNPMQNSSLNSSKLIDLGWNCLFNEKDGFFHTVKIIKEASI